jgi:hypothetical protein
MEGKDNVEAAETAVEMTCPPDVLRQAALHTRLKSKRRKGKSAWFVFRRSYRKPDRQAEMLLCPLYARKLIELLTCYASRKMRVSLLRLQQGIAHIQPVARRHARKSEQEGKLEQKIFHTLIHNTNLQGSPHIW